MRIDCHFHVFTSGTIAQPAPPPGAAYQSPTVGIEDYWDHISELEITHGVVIQPSTFGTEDHRILVDVLAKSSGRLRGIACLDPNAPDAQLSELSDAGVVGTRVQDGYPGGIPVERLKETADRVADLGWHVEVWSDLRRHLSWLGDTIADLKTDIVFDHMGNIPSDITTDSSDMQAILELVALPNVWVTLSGSERLFPAGVDRTDPHVVDRHEKEMAERARAFQETAPTRTLWGSDWPHVVLASPPSVNELSSRLSTWFIDQSVRDSITVTNNARRYGFS